ncbi:hypothetical protein FGB62_155g11 [Gracilaria domingensis]|nr:hypothetical protein FGB62_155g11 [Gracilaria domingensis]
MASNYGVIAYIKATVLRDVTQPALIRFETAYSAYKEKCSDLNRNRSSDDQMAIASIRDCIESSTPHALCIMGEIENASTAEEASPENVQEWFDGALSAAPKDLSKRIEAALASVSYSVCEQDPAGAVNTFVINALDQHNACSILSDRDKAKFMINKLEEKLEPPLLRERVKMRRALWNTDEKSDIKFFRKEVAALAVDVSQNDLARSRMYSSGKRARTDQARKPGKPSNSRRLGADKKYNAAPFLGKHSSRSSQTRPTAKDWTEKCLNPACGEIHRVKNCPITSPEERQRLLDQYFKTKKAAKAVRKSEVAA